MWSCGRDRVSSRGYGLTCPQARDLRKFLTAERVRIKEQLREAESGRFQIYSVDSHGQKEDHTPEHIDSLKRIIAEYDQILS
jgi:hypothetical protein